MVLEASPLVRKSGPPVLLIPMVFAMIFGLLFWNNLVLLLVFGVWVVCLGIFGDTGKANRVIPNKAFQILLSGKPLITRDSAAIRELIGPDHNGVLLVPPANPQALADAVRSVIQWPTHRGFHNSLRERISPSGVAASFLAKMKIDDFD